MNRFMQTVIYGQISFPKKPIYPIETPSWLTDPMTLIELANDLKDIREQATSLGYNCQETVIGIYNDILRMADESGCYDYHITCSGKVVRKCLGTPNRATEHIALMEDIARFA